MPRRRMKSGCCEHPPVFTLGMAADRSHVLARRRHPRGADRPRRAGDLSRPRPAGGLPLLDVRRTGPERARPGRAAGAGGDRSGRRRTGSRPRAGAMRPVSMWRAASWPASGMRIRRGASYHGLALNVDMDLSPFARINPCGMAGMQVTQLADLGMPGERGGGRARLRAAAGAAARGALQHHDHAFQRLQVGVQRLQLRFGLHHHEVGQATKLLCAGGAFRDPVLGSKSPEMAYENTASTLRPRGPRRHGPRP